MTDYLDLLAQRVVVFDGATATNLQLLQLGPDDFGGPGLQDCFEVLIDTRPDLVADLHRRFFEAGVDVIETNSFGSSPVGLARFGIADRSEELSYQAAAIAKSIAREYSTPDRPRFVAGSIGPGPRETDGSPNDAKAREGYAIQARGLLAGGVDLLVVETATDPRHIVNTTVASRRAMRDTRHEVPLQVQISIGMTEKLSNESMLSDLFRTLDASGADVVGLNCVSDLRQMQEAVRALSTFTTRPIAAVPSAGLPIVVDDTIRYDLSPSELAEQLFLLACDREVVVVGGCCGTTPEHLKAVVERFGDRSSSWTT